MSSRHIKVASRPSNEAIIHIIKPHSHSQQPKKPSNDLPSTHEIKFPPSHQYRRTQTDSRRVYTTTSDDTDEDDSMNESPQSSRIRRTQTTQTPVIRSRPTPQPLPQRAYTYAYTDSLLSSSTFPTSFEEDTTPVPIMTSFSLNPSREDKSKRSKTTSSRH